MNHLLHSCFPLLLLILCPPFVETYYFTRGPSSVIIPVLRNPRNQFATIDCQFTPKFNSALWQYTADIKNPVNSQAWREVFVDDLSHTLYSNWSLRISTLPKSEKRLYRCIGRIYEFGSVISKPVLVQSGLMPKSTSDNFQPIRCYEGGLLKLLCPVSGVPLPEVSWFRDQTLVSISEPRITAISLHADWPAALEIDNVQLKDRGLYSCKAVNAYGEVTVNVSRVEVIKGHIRENLQFYEAPPNVSAITGERVVLQCAAHGFPTAVKYSWRKDTNEKLSDDDYIPSGSGDIILPKVTRSDAGSYKCIATFTSGKVEALSQKAIYLKVNEPPSFSPVSEQGSYEEVPAIEQGVVRFTCQVDGMPLPRVVWYKDGKPISIDNVYFVQNQDSLAVYGLLLSDTGVYECWAYNEFGSVTKLFHLTVSPKPPDVDFGSRNAPRNLMCKDTLTDSIELSWKAPATTNKFKVSAYEISYYESTIENPRVKKLFPPSEKRDELVWHLKEDTLYTFEVKPIGPNNEIASAAMLKCRTLLKYNVGVFNVFVDSLEAKSALVKWMTGSGWYSKYSLEYNTSCFSNQTIALRATTTEKEASLEGLEENCQYNVLVSAENEHGQISTGETSFVTPASKPDEPPRDVRAIGIGKNKIEVWWSKPEEMSLNGKLTSYLVRSRKLKKKKVINTVDLESPTTHVILEGLVENQVYQVAVAAVNSEGSGPFSEYVDVRTLQVSLTEDRVPRKVTGLKVVNVDDTSIKITWDGVSSQDTIRVRAYAVYIDESMPRTVHEEIPATQTWYLFTNLKPGQNYIIKVAARNKIGISEGYQKLQTTHSTPASVNIPLKMPNNVSVKAMNSHTLRVQFTPNNPLKSEAWYKVRVTCRFPTVFTREVHCRIPLNNCLITGLRPGTEYDIDVQAVRGSSTQSGSVINSPWSMAAIGKTMEKEPTSPPIGLTAQAVPSKPRNVLLSWLQPNDVNGRVTGYDLSYTTDLSARDWALEQIIGNIFSYEVKDLTLQTTYYFRIAARNTKGLGPSTDTPVSFTTSNIPEEGYKGIYKEKGESKSEDLKREYIYIIIAGVVGGTVIIVCLIVAFVVCKIMNDHARASDKQNAINISAGLNQQGGNLYNKQQPSQDIPDLWVHHEMDMKPGKEGSLTYMQTSSIDGGGAGYRPDFRSASPPDIQKLAQTAIMQPSPVGSVFAQQVQGRNISPAVPSVMAMDSHFQDSRLIRPAPLRAAAPPLSHHPMSLHSELPMRAIPPTFVHPPAVPPGHPQFNQNPTPPPNNTYASNRNSLKTPTSSITPTFPEYSQTGSEIYTPGSSNSGGGLSLEGTLTRQDSRPFKPLPSMPPELKPLASLNTFQVQQGYGPHSVNPHVFKPAPLPPGHLSGNASVASDGNPTGIDCSVQEADKYVNRIDGMMNKFKQQTENVNNPGNSYLLHRSCEMDC